MDGGGRFGYLVYLERPHVEAFADCIAKAWSVWMSRSTPACLSVAFSFFPLLAFAESTSGGFGYCVDCRAEMGRTKSITEEKQDARVCTFVMRAAILLAFIASFAVLLFSGRPSLRFVVDLETLGGLPMFCISPAEFRICAHVSFFTFLHSFLFFLRRLRFLFSRSLRIL